MRSTMACTDMDTGIHRDEERAGRPGRTGTPLRKYYQASEVMPESKGPLHELLHKQPAVLGSLQMVSGVLSVGVGILFAVTQEMNQSLFTLFRVSHLTGMLFFTAGLFSNLLFKYPTLLPVSFGINCGCIATAVVAACLIGVDLAQWNKDHEAHLMVEVLVLSLLALEILLSVILCFWCSKEKQSKSP